MACSLSKLVLRLEKIQPSKVEVKKAELLGIGWTFEFGKKIMPKKGSGHVVLIVQRHHFASYLERGWQCSTYDIYVANVSIGAYDKTGTMTTSQMAVAKLVAMCRRPIILPKFRVDGITYNPLDGVILNWPTDQMDASLQMIARVAAVCKNASITQAKQKYDALGMPTQAAPKFVFFFQHLGFADINQGFAVQVLVHCLGQTIEAGRLMMNSLRKKFKISSSNPNLEDKVVLQGKGNVMN